MAETSRRQAAQRLDVAEQAIVSERDQNARVLKETRAHISRLRRIAARSGFAEGNPGAGGLQSMHQLAMVSNELAVKEIEETRLAAREAYLKSLAEQPAGSAFRALPAASADLIVLGREASDARTAVAEASQTYAGKQVEINRLRDELKIVQAKLDDMSSTLAARAWDKPVSAVFVPDANASNYRPGMPLYSCKLLLVMCTQTGKTGQMLAESAGETHPLFGNPVSGTYVEAIMSGTAQPQGALVHAGGKPLLF
jgi:chromosome segregation ATPase